MADKGQLIVKQLHWLNTSSIVILIIESVVKPLSNQHSHVTHWDSLEHSLRPCCCFIALTFTLSLAGGEGFAAQPTSVVEA